MGAVVCNVTWPGYATHGSYPVRKGLGLEKDHLNPYTHTGGEFRLLQ
jgi:hypothetical protein